MLVPLLLLVFSTPFAKPAHSKNKEVKAISCAVCRLGVAEAAKLEERLTDDTLEHLCEPKKQLGRWLARLDISVSPEKKRLIVTDRGGFGICRMECSTAARACRRSLLDAHDPDALLESLNYAV